MAGVHSDIERLCTTSGQTSDASPFRTAVRNIIAACRNSPLALAAYCREGVVPALATSLAQVSPPETVAWAAWPPGRLESVLLPSRAPPHSCARCTACWSPAQPVACSLMHLRR